MKGTVLVAGLGLIGGSLCISIKREHPEADIIGYDKNTNESELAKELGIIDDAAASFEQGAEKADLIILAVPVTQIIKLFDSLRSLNLKKNVLITDTGSVKQPIMEASRLLSEKGVAFIGGHPMAGSHKSGVTAAKDLLFENAFYILTPGETAAEQDLAKLEAWLKGTKAKFLKMRSGEHDELTGVISHFPHLIASSLVHSAKKAHEKFPLVSRLAAGGFRDTTRIASADPAMWRDITLQNRDVLMELLKDWTKHTSELMDMIEKKIRRKHFNSFLMQNLSGMVYPPKAKERFLLSMICLWIFQISRESSLRSLGIWVQKVSALRIFVF